MLDTLLFGAFPYVAVILAVSAGLMRYFGDRFSYSSFSSQFLEDGQLFWASAPWHYGILLILLAHLLAALLPGAWGALLGEPMRLYALEVTGLALGLTTVVGIGLLIVRRFTSSRVKVVTSSMDWLLLAVLLLQVASGVFIALVYRWGSVWYLHTAVPWLWSLAYLKPQTQYIANLPFVAKLHFFNAFLIVALFPFSRLVHIFTVPVTYLWRPWQVVVWNRRAGLGQRP